MDCHRLPTMSISQTLLPSSTLQTPTSTNTRANGASRHSIKLVRHGDVLAREFASHTFTHNRGYPQCHTDRRHSSKKLCFPTANCYGQRPREDSTTNDKCHCRQHSAAAQGPRRCRPSASLHQEYVLFELIALDDYRITSANILFFSSVAVGAFRVAVELDLKRKDNDKKFAVLFVEMRDMMAVLGQYVLTSHPDVCCDTDP